MKGYQVLPFLIYRRCCVGDEPGNEAKPTTGSLPPHVSSIQLTHKRLSEAILTLPFPGFLPVEKRSVCNEAH